MDINSQNMKLALQNTAVKLFKERGYDKVSVNEIAENCGISKAGFYYHFKSKEELISSYYNEIYQQLPENLLEALTIKSDVEKLWFFLSPAIDTTIMNGADILGQIFKSNLDEDKGTFTHVEGKVRDVCIKLIEEGQETGEIKNPSAPDEIFEHIYYLIIGIASIWCMKKGAFDEKEEIRKHFNILLGIN